MSYVLANSKWIFIKVNSVIESAAIQQMLFQMGCAWRGHPYRQFNNDPYIAYILVRDRAMTKAASSAAPKSFLSFDELSFADLMELHQAILDKNKAILGADHE